jgi:hypothetical protein
VGGRDILPVGRLCSLKMKTCGETLCEMKHFVFRQSAGSGWARGLYQRRNVKVCVLGIIRATYDSLT